MEGNDAFTKKEYDRAASLYTQAIELESANHILYSNRAAAYLGLDKNAEAIADADMSILLKPDFAKAYFRKVTALHNVSDPQGNFSEAYFASNI